MLSDSDIREAMIDYASDPIVRHVGTMMGLPVSDAAPLLRIEPFSDDNLGPASYDVRLGYFYYTPNSSFTDVYLIADKTSAGDYWNGPFDARDMAYDNQSSPDITIPAGETVLAHTEEWFSLSPHIAAQMQSRSSIGRSGLSVCKCSGFVDPGYSGRITMEISNHTRTDIRIPVGIRIAQIVFHRVDKVERPYNGKYGRAPSPSNWGPEDMTPKLYLD